MKIIRYNRLDIPEQLLLSSEKEKKLFRETLTRITY